MWRGIPWILKEVPIIHLCLCALKLNWESFSSSCIHSLGCLFPVLCTQLLSGSFLCCSRLRIWVEASLWWKWGFNLEYFASQGELFWSLSWLLLDDRLGVCRRVFYTNSLFGLGPILVHCFILFFLNFWPCHLFFSVCFTTVRTPLHHYRNDWKCTVNEPLCYPRYVWIGSGSFGPHKKAT